MKDDEQLAVLLVSDPRFEDAIRLSDDILSREIDSGIERLFDGNGKRPEISFLCHQVRDLIRSHGFSVPESDSQLLKGVVRVVALHRRWRVL